MTPLGTITIQELEVHYRVGVTTEERSRPQRLHLVIQMQTDFSTAAQNDSLENTIDYHAVCQRLLNFGEERQWKLIETLARDIAEMIHRDFHPDSVCVEVRKFIIPQTRFVSVSIRLPD